MQRGEGEGRCRRAPAFWLVLLAGLAGCASAPVLRDGLYRDPVRGWRIASPGEGWRRIALDGAVLAFRGPDGSTLALAERCHIPMAEPSVLARHLWIGSGVRLREAAPDAVAGRSAWAQTLEAPDGTEVRTVTMATRDCVFDWALSGTQLDARTVEAFERWVQSFTLGPAAGPREDRP